MKTPSLLSLPFVIALAGCSVSEKWKNEKPGDVYKDRIEAAMSGEELTDPGVQEKFNSVIVPENYSEEGQSEEDSDDSQRSDGMVLA